MPARSQKSPGGSLRPGWRLHRRWPGRTAIIGSSVGAAPAAEPYVKQTRRGRARHRGRAPLVSLLALNGLRVSEATGADIEALGTERGHRTLAITRKGGKKAVIPLAPRTAGRSSWPSATAAKDRSSPPPPGSAALHAGVPLRDAQEAASHADPRITMRYDRARASLDRYATYIVAAYLAGADR